MSNGVRPDRIAFVSFTQKAAYEAADRACVKFNLTRNDLPYFRTLHSLAYRQLALSKTDVMTAGNYREFGESFGCEFTGTYSMEEGLPTGGKQGDMLLFLDNLARAREVPLREQWRVSRMDLPWELVDQFSRSFAAYKQDVGLLDYTDFLERYVHECTPLDAQVVFVDEAQDLSKLQWRMVRHLVQRAERVYIAGDDDQAIYKWSGADVETFLSLEGKLYGLTQSHRLPRKVHEFSKRIVSRIHRRYQKDFLPNDREGHLRFHTQVSSIDLRTEGDWLLLARNTYMLSHFQRLAEEQGVAYTLRGAPSISPTHVRAIYAWERMRKGLAVPADELKHCYTFLKSGAQVRRGFKTLPRVDPLQEVTLVQARSEYGLLVDGPWHDVFTGIPHVKRFYYRRLLREHGSLKQAPRVHIHTIHGVKGGEADHVAVLPDMSYRTNLHFQHTPDDEHRVFYVAATRAKQSLHVLLPQSSAFYPMPA